MALSKICHNLQHEARTTDRQTSAIPLTPAQQPRAHNGCRQNRDKPSARYHCNARWYWPVYGHKGNNQIRLNQTAAPETKTRYQSHNPPREVGTAVGTAVGPAVRPDNTQSPFFARFSWYIRASASSISTASEQGASGSNSTMP